MFFIRFLVLIVCFSFFKEKLTLALVHVCTVVSTLFCYPHAKRYNVPIAVYVFFLSFLLSLFLSVFYDVVIAWSNFSHFSFFDCFRNVYFANLHAFQPLSFLKSLNLLSLSSRESRDLYHIFWLVHFQSSVVLSLIPHQCAYQTKSGLWWRD